MHRVHLVHRVYISPCELDEETIQGLGRERDPDRLLMGTVEDMLFNTPDRAKGPWLNYAVGISGTWAEREADAMWPNEVSHLCSYCVAHYPRCLLAARMSYPAPFTRAWQAVFLLHRPATGMCSNETTTSKRTLPHVTLGDMVQIWHGKRSAYNLRNISDLAQFLAVPSKATLDEHHINLRLALPCVNK